jgi:hypothetical protein
LRAGPEALVTVPQNTLPQRLLRAGGFEGFRYHF